MITTPFHFTRVRWLTVTGRISILQDLCPYILYF